MWDLCETLAGDGGVTKVLNEYPNSFGPNVVMEEWC